MDKIDTSLSAPIIAQWGAYGVILIVLCLVIGWLGKALYSNLKDQVKDVRDTTTAAITSNASSTQAINDMRVSIEALVKLIDRLLDNSNSNSNSRSRT